METPLLKYNILIINELKKMTLIPNRGVINTDGWFFKHGKLGAENWGVAR